MEKVKVTKSFHFNTSFTTIEDENFAIDNTTNKTINVNHSTFCIPKSNTLSHYNSTKTIASIEDHIETICSSIILPIRKNNQYEKQIDIDKLNVTESPDLEIPVPVINKSFEPSIFKGKFEHHTSPIEKAACDNNINLINNSLSIKTKLEISQNFNKDLIRSKNINFTTSESKYISNWKNNRENMKSKLSTNEICQPIVKSYSFIETKPHSIMNMEGYLIKKPNHFYKKSKNLYCLIKNGVFKAYSDYKLKRTSLVFKLENDLKNIEFSYTQKPSNIELK